MVRSFALRIAPSAVFVAAFFVVPVGVLVSYSLAHSTFISVDYGLFTDSYSEAVTTPLFRELLFRSIAVGAMTGALCVALAYPLAYAITLGPLRTRGDLILFLVLISLFSPYIVRVYAWRTVLGGNGFINSALQAVGLTDEPLDFLLYSRFAVVVTLVNVLVPLAVLPLYSSLASVDRNLVEAARSLGGSSLKTLWHVTLPLSSRGVTAAFSLCFVLAAGDYVTPQLVGGTKGQMIGNVIVARFGVAFDAPLGSALAFVLITLMALTIALVFVAFRVLRLTDRPAR